MSTPKWFHLPALRMDLAQVLERTRALREVLGLLPREVSALRWDEGERSFEFQPDSTQDIRSELEAIEAARGWDGLCITWLVRPIRAFIYLHCWEQAGLVCTAIETDDQIPYSRIAPYAEGQWLEQFMCRWVSTCGLDACAHGRQWPPAHVALEATHLVERVKSGDLLKQPLPMFFMLAEGLVRFEELEVIHQKLNDLDRELIRLFHIPSGYHVLSSLCRRPWWREQSSSLEPT